MLNLFTSESVTEGHPDKVADAISDAILDAVLIQDPDGRVAAEVMVTGDHVFIGGEITTKATVDYANITAEVIRSIGYTYTPQITLAISEQSPDISEAVNQALEAKETSMNTYDFIQNALKTVPDSPWLISTYNNSICFEAWAPNGKNVVLEIETEGKDFNQIAADISQYDHWDAFANCVEDDWLEEEVALFLEVKNRNPHFGVPRLKQIIADIEWETEHIHKLSEAVNNEL